MTDATDEELLNQVRLARSERAFAVLYDRHTPYLWRLALRLAGGDSETAREAVSEAWVRAFVRLDRFEGRSRLSTWLAGFLVNVSRELSRGAARTESLEDIAMESKPSDPVSRIDIDRALARLPDGFRQVLVLHDVEGYTHEEIAEMLGIVPGTSKSQLSRARQRVRELMHESQPQ